jgi:hypothetical protein
VRQHLIDLLGVEAQFGLDLLRSFVRELPVVDGLDVCSSARAVRILMTIITYSPPNSFSFFDFGTSKCMVDPAIDMKLAI